MHYSKVMVSQSNVRSGETVCVLADEKVETNLVDNLIKSSEEVGAETHALKVKTQDIDSKTVIDVVSNYSVIFALTSGYGISPESLRNVLSKGSRVVRFIHASVKTASECLSADFGKMQKDAAIFSSVLTRGREIHVTSARGSDLTLSTQGKPALYWDSIKRKGETMIIPRGSINAVPVEDVGEGSLVIDGTTWQFGHVREPFKLIVRRGRVQKVVGSGREADWIRDVLKKPFEDANRLAEFVVGLNPGASFNRYMPEGEKVRGAVAVDMGYRPGIGDTELGRHTDVGSVRNVTMTVDDKKMMEKGRLLIIGH